MKSAAQALLVGLLALAHVAAHAEPDGTWFEAESYVLVTSGQSDPQSEEFDNGEYAALTLGWRASPNWAIEGTYFDLAEAEGDIVINGLGNVSQEFQGSGINVSLVRLQPVTKALGVYAKLGLAFWDGEFNIENFGEGQSLKGEDLTLGIGASYKFLSNWSAVIDWQRYKLQDSGDENSTLEDDIDSLSVGIKYRF